MKKYIIAGLAVASFAALFALGLNYAVKGESGVTLAEAGAVDERAVGVVDSVDAKKGVLVLKESGTGKKLTLEAEAGKLKGLKAGDKVKVEYHRGAKNVAFYMRKMGPMVSVGC